MTEMVGYVQGAQTLWLTGCLLWCVGSDLLQRRIPNRAVLMLLLGWIAVGILTAILAGTTVRPATAMLHALPGAAVVFVVGFLLFLTGRLGAGDVKMMSVLCLWVGSGQQLAFVMVTALAGGVLALILPLLNTIPPALALGIDNLNRRLHLNIASPTVLPADLSQGLPYGIAIAFGAAYILIWPLF
nr:prepilin peptidase [Lonsdalea britannica]